MTRTNIFAHTSLSWSNWLLCLNFDIYEIGKKIMLIWIEHIHENLPCIATQKKTKKIGFQERYSLNAGQKYCRMLPWSILQYFWPALRYHMAFKPLFCLFLSGRFRPVSQYPQAKIMPVLRRWFCCCIFIVYCIFWGTVFSCCAVQY